MQQQVIVKYTKNPHIFLTMITYITLTESLTLTAKYRLICLRASLVAQELEIARLAQMNLGTLESLRNLGNGLSPDRTYLGEGNPK